MEVCRTDRLMDRRKKEDGMKDECIKDGGMKDGDMKDIKILDKLHTVI
jgi:hypothetical protein